MTEVLGRLLGNAAKFTAEGGEFGLRVTATLLEVRFEVWDRGIGIEVENIAKLFQPFVQLDGRLARRYDGTGLGLALVKQWVDLHGGRIAVESERGAGSRFSVVLARVGGASPG
jgi:signal transduction histidine kinase